MDQSAYLSGIHKQFTYYKWLAEQALEQVNEDEFFEPLVSYSNSLAVIVKHLSGNIVSRWTEFTTSDGEKPWRNRDDEFLADEGSKSEYMAHWEKAWIILFREFEILSPDQLGEQVLIRNQVHTIPDTLQRQLTHIAYHVGQIVFLSKYFRNSDWKSLSIPLGKSQAYNAKAFKSGLRRGHYTDDIIK